MTMRIGQGFDIHRLVKGRPCIIGGVTIPFELGPDGHSDADPLLHAIIDALLGAAALGDIGEHFPDTDPRYKGADSKILLRETVAKLTAAGWRVVNIDASVLTEVPKLKPHKKPMAETIARLVAIPADRVNIKAKTMEGMDAIGRKEAVAVHCVALIERDATKVQIS